MGRGGVRQEAPAFGCLVGFFDFYIMFMHYFDKGSYCNRQKRVNTVHGISKPFAFAITESISRVEWMALKTWLSSVFLQRGGR